ncbi:MAG: hypothetical protein JRS35_02235 [Deltaproteobacteria bacterium]|nr:hypothetical protein [Deltaproteobacteria bacterium]
MVPIAAVPTRNMEGSCGFDRVAGRYRADRVRAEDPENDRLAGREGRIARGIYAPDALRRKGLR